MEEIEAKLGYEFKDKELLKTALTHSSYANENKKRNLECNERLEFLGDAVLGMVVANYLFRGQQKMPEGQMTRLRAELVCEQSLARVAEELQLGNYLLLGKGEEQGGGRKRHSIIADAVEAVIAAVYLDGGYEKASGIIYKFIIEPMEKGIAILVTDYKTALQEFVQRKSGQVLAYNLVDQSGPDHDKVFTFSVSLNGEVVGTGSGKNKKEAEQAAAGDALRKLQNET